MLTSEIKSRFKTLFDEMYSGDMPNGRLTNIFAHAQTNYWEKLMNQYQLNSAITSELKPLIKNITVTPTSNEIDVDTLIASDDYKRLLALRCTFSDGVTSWAKELLTEELLSYFSRGTTRYPRYYQANNNILIEPASVNCTSANVMYFRKPFNIDFDTPTDDIPYIEISIENIIQEALAVAASIVREDTFYQISESEANRNRN
jgi:hypothetical protein